MKRSTKVSGALTDVAHSLRTVKGMITLRSYEGQPPPAVPEGIREGSSAGPGEGAVRAALAGVYARQRADEVIE